MYTYVYIYILGLVVRHLPALIREEHTLLLTLAQRLDNADVVFHPIWYPSQLHRPEPLIHVSYCYYIYVFMYICTYVYVC